MANFSESNVLLSIERTHSPSLHLATVAQKIGYQAWHDRMENRSDTEIRHVFNPNGFQNSQRLLERMKSKIGKFVGVVALHGDQEVGYAWAANDVGNMSLTKQKIKTLGGKLQGKKPYAWVAQINVLPQFQDVGIGTALLMEVLEPFEEDQKPSAYVFDENRITLDWFKSRGFNPRPKEASDPNDSEEGPDMYFGEDATHVSQWRLEAPSVLEVVTNEDAISHMALHRTKDLLVRR